MRVKLPWGLHWLCCCPFPSPPARCAVPTCCATAQVCCAHLPAPCCCPMGGISLCSLPQSVADSSWITELLWTFFVPFTVYQVRYYVSLFCLGQGLGWAGLWCHPGTESSIPGASAGLGLAPSGPGHVQLLMWRGLLVPLGEGEEPQSLQVFSSSFQVYF